jgi:endoglucanase
MNYLKCKFTIKTVVMVLLICGLTNCKKDKKSPVAVTPVIPPIVVPPVVVVPPVAMVGTAVENYGQLQVTGNKILGKGNTPVQLRGMSLFWSQWIGKYYNAEAIKWLKDDWRCTVVRASMGVGMAEDGYLKNPEREKQKVIDVVDAAIKEGIYVIIDWHDHHAESNTEASKTFFSEMAAKYGDKPNVIYEIYNEPLNVSWNTVIKPYSEAVIAAIRAKDPDNLIICGTGNWSQRVNEAASNQITDPNVAYTLHFYSATHKQSLRDDAIKALSKGAALFVTEFGTSEASGDGTFDKAETNTWFTFLDENKISWCNWSLADKSETSAALKPGASATGGWASSQLSESGIFIRDYLRAKNPAK